MKKLIFIFSSLFMGQASLAMEQEFKPKLTLEESNKLAKELNDAIRLNIFEKARWLIAQGANVNFIDRQNFMNLGESILMNAVEKMDHPGWFTNGQEKLFAVISDLIDRGADVNHKINSGWNAILLSNDERVTELLLQNGADIYSSQTDGITPLERSIELGHLRPVKLILEIASRMHPDDVSHIKTWLLTEVRLRNDKLLHLPKDIRKKIILSIVDPQDIRERVCRAAGSDSLELATKNMDLHDGPEILKLLTQHLDLEFLKALVLKQVGQLFTQKNNVQLLENNTK